MARDCKLLGHLWCTEIRNEKVITLCWACGVEKGTPAGLDPNEVTEELAYLEEKLREAAYAGIARVDVRAWELARVVGKLRELLKGDAR